MKIIVVGGVAAGTKAAAKLKRENRDYEVKILTKGKDISYAGCGLPYYLSGAIPSREDLIVNTPEKFAALTGAQVLTECEVTAVSPAEKTVTAIHHGQTITEHYDKLVLATGASAIVPPIKGVQLPGVFCLRTPEDAIGLREYVQQQNCRTACVVGAGFIGLEAAENLMARGLRVSVVDAAPQIMPQAFDAEMAGIAQRQLKAAGMRVQTGCRLLEVQGEERATGIVTDAGSIPADVVVLAIGVRPATAFLQEIGLEMEKGAIVVDAQMRTNLADIYAAGDCALVKNAITQQPQWSAMGSTANLCGRVLAKALCGETAAYGGCMGTGVVKLLEQLNAGRTGLTEQQAKAAGYATATVVCVTDDKAHYYPGAGDFITKLVVEEPTHRLLGIQVLGAGAVDKMVDIAVTGISCGMKIEDFNTLDYAYAPPFSTAIHPFVQACYIMENKLNGELNSMTPAEYLAGAAKDYRVIDALPQPTIPGATWVDLSTVNGPVPGLDPQEKLLLVCARGKRGYFMQNRLKHYGYTNTRVLEGGITVNDVKVPRKGADLPPEEVKRVKGLGCLQDKRQPDHFNVRVITRNGKLTSEEQIAVAEAAKRFGSGEVTMTTRLTLEIQGVPYENLEELMAFLQDAGLQTGGTGSKVRPVVSCKGTTCQYGLCDTFALSEKLHERFYIGWHDLSLPHKFKLAVGGCPNNCVKPDLNDLGIIGQSVPQLDAAKCRGCKVCQVEKTCPIHVAAVQNGKLVIDAQACNHCGRCIPACPFGALEEALRGYKVYLGGRWGKRTASGRPLSQLFTSDEQVMDLVEKAILFFREYGISGERFSDTIDRLGFEYVEDQLLHGELDREAARQKEVKGGATC